MKFRFFQALAACFALFATASFTNAIAHDFKVGDLVIDHPYASTTPAGATVGGGYIKSITNNGSTPDQLVSARSPIAQSVEIHQMTMQGDVMRMKEVPFIEIPAKGKVELKRGGAATYHLMLMGLKAPLKEGDRFPVTLVFKKAGEKEVSFTVQMPATMQNDPQHGGHKGH